MHIIRKISVGRDYPNGVIHYQVGTKMNLGKGSYQITSIEISDEFMEIGKVAYNIFIGSKEGSVLWKTVQDVPVIVEYNIDFE